MEVLSQPVARGSQSARLFGWPCECRSVGRSCIAACMCVPALGVGTTTPRKPGIWGSWGVGGAPCRAPCPHLLRRTLQGISQAIAVFAKTKIWGPGSHRGLHPKPVYSTRAAALFLTLLAGRLPSPLGTFSRLLPTPTSPDPSPSGTAVVMSGSGCICAVSLLPSPNLPASSPQGAAGGPGSWSAVTPFTHPAAPSPSQLPTRRGGQGETGG